MRKKRAKGGFFAAAEATPYQPIGVLYGQKTAYSCTAACCRMLLLDYVPTIEDDYQVSESFLRSALAIDYKGATIERVPDVLRDSGLPISYGYRKDFAIDDLRDLVQNFPAIAMVRAKGDDDFHALIVDQIDDDWISIRDPLPEGAGAAYRVSRETFLNFWIDDNTGGGRAIVVLE